MKNLHIILIAMGLFLLLSLFTCNRMSALERMTEKKTALETKFVLLEKEKADLRADLTVKQANLYLLEGQKSALEFQLAQYKADAQKQIESFKKTISELNSIPADTVYQNIYSLWSTYGGVLKFRFAENQIRGIYLSILERDQFESLYIKTNKSLLICTDLNIKNNLIIGNLSDQNVNFKKQVDLSGSQISNLQDNLKLTEKQLNKKGFWNWVWKGGTIVGASGWIAFVLK